MERTTKPIGKRRRLINENLLIPHIIVKQILRKGNGDALSLYMFYVYTGNWQHTNQPRATEKYCLDGLSIGRPRFLKAKKILEELKLIKLVQNKDDKNSFGEWKVQLLSHSYSGSYRTAGIDSPVINNEGEADFWKNLKCSECGTPLFITGLHVSGRQNPDAKDKEQKNSINVGSPEDSPTKKEIKPIEKMDCPFNHEFGKDYYNYELEPIDCPNCDINGDCVRYKNKYFPDKTI